MKHRTRVSLCAPPRALLLAPLALALPLAACGSSGPKAPPPPIALTAAPWTDAFEAEAVLLANEVLVEGPDGLAQHFVATQDPDRIAYTAATTTRGLEQVFEPAPGHEAVELRGQLDGLRIVALESLTVVQRPGRVPVRVVATGAAYHALADGTSERRAERIVLDGPIPWGR